MLPSTSPAAAANDSMLEPYRPRVHFSARREWINDPNGLVYLDGEYHLFFQCNPSSTQWGNMSWGHAVSRDLIGWTQLDHALLQRPDPMDTSRTESIFSGCTVLDADNVSGLGSPGQPALLAFYTSHYDRAKAPYGRQVQSLAYSLDRGRNWVFYRDNPLIALDRDNDHGFNADEFRDPKVFYHQDSGRWIMLLVLATDRKVAFYGSDNLLDWDFLSVFSDPGDTDDLWEVPDLLHLPVEGGDEHRWLLVVSLNNLGRQQQAGSLMVYFVGDFDGRHFYLHDTETRAHRDGEFTGDNRFDWGRDFYAAVSFHNAPGAYPIMIGWMNNWRYANDTPSVGFRGQMSLARRIGLRRCDSWIVPVQQPLGLATVAPRVIVDGLTLEPEQESCWPVTVTAPLVIDLEAQLGDASLCLELCFGSEPLRLDIDPRAGTLSLDRSRLLERSVHPDFATEDLARTPVSLRELNLRIVIDSASVEVFAQDGGVAITQQVFPAAPLCEVRLLAGSVPVKSVSLSLAALVVPSHQGGTDHY